MPAIASRHTHQVEGVDESEGDVEVGLDVTEMKFDGLVTGRVDKHGFAEALPAQLRTSTSPNSMGPRTRSARATDAAISLALCSSLPRARSRAADGDRP